MIPEAGIDVGNPNGNYASLTVDYSKIFNKDGCPIWRSIRPSTSGATTLWIEGSEIKDAYYGVDIAGNVQNLLTVLNSQFINNFVGLYIQDDVIPLEISGSTFKTDGMLDSEGSLSGAFPFAPYLIEKAYAGIQLSNTNFTKQVIS